MKASYPNGEFFDATETPSLNLILFTYDMQKQVRIFPDCFALFGEPLKGGNAA